MKSVLELRCVTGSGGGPEKTILLSAARADAERFRVIVAYLRPANDLGYTIGERARALGISFQDIPERFSFDPRILLDVGRIIAHERIDLVHAHDYKTTCIAIILSALFGFKVVSTSHGWVTRSPKLEAYYLIDKIALRGVERVMAVSPDIRDELLRWGLSSDRVVYLPNGVDTEQFHPGNDDESVRNELGIDSGHPLIGAIGRLSPEKDLPTFLEIARRVRQQIPLAHFVIVGEGPEKERLEQISKTLGLDGAVAFLGQRGDIIRIYNSLDLFLLTSLREGLPNVVLEAMAMEVPVISTRVAGIGELIEDRVNGRLFEPRDVDGMGNAVIELLHDHDGASRLARAARDTVCQRFSFDQRVRRMEALYLDVLGH